MENSIKLQLIKMTLQVKDTTKNPDKSTTTTIVCIQEEETYVGCNDDDDITLL